MKKNVIVFDRSNKKPLFPSELLAANYHIAVLVVTTDTIANDMKEQYKHDTRITHILSMHDVEHLNGIPYLDYELLEVFRETQYKIEFAYHRWLNDGMLATNRFINALCWWNHIFDTFHIDLVLIDNLEHGYTYDIPAHIARHRGVPAFFVTSSTCHHVSILHHNCNTYIPLPLSQTSEVEIENSLFYKFEPNTARYSVKKIPCIKKIKRVLANIILNVFGQILVDFANCLIHKDFNTTMKTAAGIYHFPFWHKVYSLFYLKKMKRLYTSLSVQPQENENFIFYAMHFEPEGGTTVCVPLQNQLTIIQMLHNALPSGWKLYIKEHPHQFMLNNIEMGYYLYNFKWWKSIEFYQELRKLENLSFIDFNTSSKFLIEQSKAIATINGTIYLESLFNNKPCFVFGGKDILLQCAKNIIHVKNFANLQNDLKKLSREPNVFDNSENFSQCLSYLKNYTTSYPSTSYPSPMYARIILHGIHDYLKNIEMVM